ncbi:MAG: hypothetical protein RL021_1143, partial [Bacteroidota bacterium]
MLNARNTYQHGFDPSSFKGAARCILLFIASLFFGFSSFAQVSLTATSGTLTATYTSLGAAFAAINAGTHKGAIDIRITSTFTEPGATTALLRSASPSSYTSVTIKPTGNVSINGTVTAGRAIIELSGADNVTIDGDDPATTGSRNLTIAFTSTAATSTACIRVSSNSTTGTDGADNNTIKNCIITGSRSSLSTGNTFGINLSNYSSSSLLTGGYSSINNSFVNNLITRCLFGIWAQGASSGYPLTGLQIMDNVMGNGTSATNMGARGILVTNTSTSSSTTAAVISGNNIQAGAPGTSSYSLAVAGIEIGANNYGLQLFGNYIHDINQASTSYGASGIYLSTAGGNTDIAIYNNFIRAITASKTVSSFDSASYANIGVWIGAQATGIRFDHNTVVLNTYNQTGTNVNFVSAAVAVTSTSATFASFRNNILVNRDTSTKANGFYTAATAVISGAVVNNNDYYVPNGGVIGTYNSTPISTLNSWKSATGKDGNSFAISPNFVSTTDPHLNNISASVLESGGTSVSGINTDYDGQTRPGPTGSTKGGGTAPDIGADEFDGIPATTVTISNLTLSPGEQCQAVSHTITATITPGSTPVNSVVLNYSVNGSAKPQITMTNTSGNTWQATIPAASPNNGTVAWSVTATDGATTKTSSGATYQDAAISGIGLAAYTDPSPVCLGSLATLVATPYSGTAANYAAPPAVGFPLDDEDIGNVTITQSTTTLLNNSSTRNSLTGTLGTATGTAGSYSDFSALGGFTLVAGQTYSFSLSSLQSTSAFGNSMAIFIDYNRDGDFDDYSETVYIPFNTVNGAHAETGTFTVPMTAFNGLTRMRILCNEGIISTANMSIVRGEREDYGLTISSSNNGGGGGLPLLSYTWSTGTTVIGTGQYFATPINGNTTYSLSGVSTGGCSLSASVTAVTTPAPTAPTATNSTQCNPGVPSASVSSNSGLPLANFRWYTQQYGGTLLQDSTSTTYAATVSASDTLWVSEYDGTCESVRTPVYITFSAPAINASNNATICSGSSTTLTVSSTNDPKYKYTWNNSAGTGSSVTVSPSSTTTYIVTALDTTTGTLTSGCTTTDTVIVTVIPSITYTTSNSSCGSYTWSVNGATYTQSGTYISTSNCTTNVLNLTILPVNNGSGSASACNSYTWQGTTYTVSGTYTKSLTNAAGCDSTATLNLTINYSSSGSSSATACDSYTWQGTTYTTSGTYIKTLTNTAGCDSTATLNLTIYPTAQYTRTVVACDFYSWTLSAQTYTQSGTYSFINGCETSILYLTVNHPTSGSGSASACDSYTWQGTTYTSSGVYTKTLWGANSLG